jgi:hypothetical protein|tara:strand:- start:564 stop:776 length:213 start_codon:yes stop_codon:yes gene_type:complete
MKANELYQKQADIIYGKIGHARMQQKQIEELIEELEFELKALVRAFPQMQAVELEVKKEDEQPGWADEKS